MLIDLLFLFDAPQASCRRFGQSTHWLAGPSMWALQSISQGRIVGLSWALPGIRTNKFHAIGLDREDSVWQARHSVIYGWRSEIQEPGAHISYSQCPMYDCTGFFDRVFDRSISIFPSFGLRPASSYPFFLMNCRSSSTGRLSSANAICLASSRSRCSFFKSSHVHRLFSIARPRFQNNVPYWPGLCIPFLCMCRRWSRRYHLNARVCFGSQNN